MSYEEFREVFLAEYSRRTGIDFDDCGDIRIYFARGLTARESVTEEIKKCGLDDFEQFGLRRVK